MTIFYKVRTTTLKLNDINKLINKENYRGICNDTNQIKERSHLMIHCSGCTEEDYTEEGYTEEDYTEEGYTEERRQLGDLQHHYTWKKLLMEGSYCRLIKSLSVRMSCRSLFAYLTFHMNILRVVDHLLTVNLFY